LSKKINLLFSLGVGLYLSSMFCFVIGYLELLKRNIIIIYFLFLLVFSFRTIPIVFNLIKGILEEFINDIKNISTTYKIILVILLIEIISNLIFAYTPPTADDELTYHISLPLMFLEKGKIFNVYWNYANNFFLTAEFFIFFHLCLVEYML